MNWILITVLGKRNTHLAEQEGRKQEKGQKQRRISAFSPIQRCTANSSICSNLKGTVLQRSIRSHGFPRQTGVFPVGKMCLDFYFKDLLS